MDIKASPDKPGGESREAAKITFGGSSLYWMDEIPGLLFIFLSSETPTARLGDG